MGGSRSLLVIFVFTSLVIIDDLDALRRAVAPDEANSPLVVDPDTMLTLPVTAQGLKPVSWNRRHVLQLLGVVQHPKLPARHRSNVAQPAAPLAFKKQLGLLAADRIVSHGQYITATVKRSIINGARGARHVHHVRPRELNRYAASACLPPRREPRCEGLLSPLSPR